MTWRPRRTALFGTLVSDGVPGRLDPKTGGVERIPFREKARFPMA